MKTEAEVVEVDGFPEMVAVAVDFDALRALVERLDDGLPLFTGCTCPVCSELEEAMARCRELLGSTRPGSASDE